MIIEQRSLIDHKSVRHLNLDREHILLSKRPAHILRHTLNLRGCTAAAASNQMKFILHELNEKLQKISNNLTLPF